MTQDEKDRIIHKIKAFTDWALSLLITLIGTDLCVVFWFAVFYFLIKLG